MNSVSSPSIKTERIHLHRTKKYPKSYSCRCKYCKEFKGVLIRSNGSFYNRNDRRQYYHYKHGGGGAGHINPTPLHVARWAIQSLTKPGDYVVDPFVGTGTTLVESLNHGRNSFGTEVDTVELAQKNISMNRVDQMHTAIVNKEDARNIASVMVCYPAPQLAIWHPPYSGDEQSNAKYDKGVIVNMAFMKESRAYWDDMQSIADNISCGLKLGGYVVQGIKEMMRNKAWWDIHIQHSKLWENSGLTFKGTILLPHYPRTLHLNTYYKRYGIHPSYYQTIAIFRKENEL